MTGNEAPPILHVDAKFGGRAVRFELPRSRESIKVLEAAVGAVIAIWGRFQLGTWTMHDVRTVLLLAYPRPAAASSALHAFLPPASAGLSAATVEGRVDAAIASRPLSTYAPLATAILAAAVFGRVEGAAGFDEEVPGGFPPQPGAAGDAS